MTKTGEFNAQHIFCCSLRQAKSRFQVKMQRLAGQSALGIWQCRRAGGAPRLKSLLCDTQTLSFGV